MTKSGDEVLEQPYSIGPYEVSGEGKVLQGRRYVQHGWMDSPGEYQIGASLDGESYSVDDRELNEMAGSGCDYLEILIKDTEDPTVYFQVFSGDRYCNVDVS